MLLTVGKYMIAAALTLAVVTSVFVVLFREDPEAVAKADPVARTTEETTAPQDDYSQPWLDIPDPEPQPEPEPAAPPPDTEPEPEPEPEPEHIQEDGFPLPDRGDVEAARERRSYQLTQGAIMGLTVPAMDIYNAPVFDSADRWALDNGVSHIPETSLPWTNAPQRNVYLAGHRLGWPGTGSHLIFYRLNVLGEGDTVILKDRNGRSYRYRVTEKFVADPSDSWVMGQVRDRDMVTLQTCTPMHTFDKRLIVRADRVSGA